MYSRQDRSIRVPHNYGGSIFSGEQPPTPVEDRTRKSPSVPPRTQHRQEYKEREEQYEQMECKDQAEQTECAECAHECAHECECEHNGKPEACQKPPIHSLLAELGTEEILLIALALIVFGNGKEPELALILLALLFF